MKLPDRAVLRTLPLVMAFYSAFAMAGTVRTAQDLLLVVPEGNKAPATLSSQVNDYRHALSDERVLWVKSLPREGGKTSGFAAMAVLNFPGNVAIHNAAALSDPLQLTLADTLIQGGSAPPAGSKPVYKISYYQLTAPRADFEGWVNGYLEKFLEAQQQHGILTRYAMYLERGNNGRALLVLEYPDANTEQDAEPRKAKLNDALIKTDAEYVRQLGLKESLRVTQSWTLAVPAS